MRAPGQAWKGITRADVIAVVSLLAVTLAVYAPALFGGKVLLPADIVGLQKPFSAQARERFPTFRFAQNQLHGPIFEYYSWRAYSRGRLKLGEVPLWNPHEMSGNVLLANSQSAVLYPPNVLLWLLPLPVGINLVTALHTFLTGLMLFGLLRCLRLQAVSAVTGALIWMFCGLQVCWTEFQTPTAVLCWLPGLLWSWAAYVQTGRAKWSVAAGSACVALTLLAGHLHFAFYVLLAFLGYALLRRPTGVGRIRSAGVLAATLVLGAGLSLPTMLPVLEMAKVNFRSVKPSYDASVALKLPPENLATLLIPNLLGSPRDYVYIAPDGKASDANAYRGKFDYIEYACYLGLPALALLALALLRGAPESAADRRYFAALGAVGLLLALGTPLCALFFYGVPGYRQFNATARSLCLFSFGGAALAAYGVDRVLSALGTAAAAKATRSLLLVTGAVGMTGLAVFGAACVNWAWPLSDKWVAYEMGALRHLVGFTLAFVAAVMVAGRRRKFAALIPAVCCLDLLAAYRGFNPTTDPRMLDVSSRVTDFLAAQAPDRSVALELPGHGIKSFLVPNFNAPLGVREVQGADSLHTLRYHRLIEGVIKAQTNGERGFSDPNTVRVAGPRHPVLDMLNVRWVAVDPNVDLAEFGLQKAEDAEMAVWRNPNALGPAWITGRVEQVRDGQDALDKLLAPSFRANEVTLVERPIDGLDVEATGSVTIDSFAPHMVSATVSASSPTLAVFSEPFYPGWRAWVDGAEREISVVNLILRGVRVESGSQRVILRYEPFSYRLGLYLGVMSLALWAAFLTCRPRLGWPT